ncbi:MAG: hypothetical protein HON70_44520, partial [Lentisphaerae bacterium]|nr:hypothetical protein [Lentisphaerota bacterium]
MKSDSGNVVGALVSLLLLGLMVGPWVWEWWSDRLPEWRSETTEARQDSVQVQREEKPPPPEVASDPPLPAPPKVRIQDLIEEVSGLSNYRDAIVLLDSFLDTDPTEGDRRSAERLLSLYLDALSCELLKTMKTKRNIIRYWGDFDCPWATNAPDYGKYCSHFNLSFSVYGTPNAVSLPKETSGCRRDDMKRLMPSETQEARRLEGVARTTYDEWPVRTLRMLKYQKRMESLKAAIYQYLKVLYRTESVPTRRALSRKTTELLELGMRLVIEQVSARIDARIRWETKPSERWAMESGSSTYGNSIDELRHTTRFVNSVLSNYPSEVAPIAFDNIRRKAEILAQILLANTKAEERRQRQREIGEMQRVRETAGRRRTGQSSGIGIVYYYHGQRQNGPRPGVHYKYQKCPPCSGLGAAGASAAMANALAGGYSETVINKACRQCNGHGHYFVGPS